MHKCALQLPEEFWLKKYWGFFYMSAIILPSEKQGSVQLKIAGKLFLVDIWFLVVKAHKTVKLYGKSLKNSFFYEIGCSYN